VIFVNVNFSSGSTDELLGAQGKGTLVVMWDACVEESQDGVVGPIGAVVAGEAMAGS
jgi:hypothetical protein